MSEWKKLLVANPSASDIASSPSSGKVLKVGSGGALEWSTDSGGSFTTSGTVASFIGTKTEVKTTSADTVGVVLDLVKNSASPANNDVVGTISFTNNNWDSSGSELDGSQPYASIISTATNVESGASAGKLEFKAIHADTLATRLTIDGTKTTFGGYAVFGSGTAIVGNNSLIERMSEYQGRQGLNHKIEMHSTGDVSIRSSSTDDAFYIKDDGKIGIGTNLPSHPLHVNSSVSNGQLMQLHNTNNADGTFIKMTGAGSNEDWQIGAGVTGFSIYSLTDNAFRFIVANDGKIGMGTANPSQPLDVKADASSAVGLQISYRDAGDARSILRLNNNATSWDFNAIDSSLAIQHSTDGTALILSNNLDATFAGIVDAVNYKVGGAQGSDGQVLTSTGSGVAWEAIPAVSSTFTSLKVDATSGNHGVLELEAGDGTAWSIVTSVANDNLDFYNSTAGTAMSIKHSNGSVGIGTTSPDAPLHIKAKTSGWDGSIVLEENDDGTANMITRNEDNLWFGYSSSASDVTSGTKTLMVMHESGKIGIGVHGEPSAPLHLKGQTSASGTTQFRIEDSRTGDNTITAGGYMAFHTQHTGSDKQLGYIYHSQAGTTHGNVEWGVKGTLSGVGNKTLVKNRDNGVWYFYNNYTENLAMVIKDQKVGIGGVTAPTRPLHIKSTDASATVLLENTTQDASGGAILNSISFNHNATLNSNLEHGAIGYYAGETWDDTKFYQTINNGNTKQVIAENIRGNKWKWYTDGTERMTIHHNGTKSRVGINNTSPDYALDIINDGDNQFRVGRSASKFVRISDDVMAFTGMTGNGMRILTTDASDIKIGTNGTTDKLVIKSDGKVGIVASAPTEALTVNGNLNLLPANSKLYWDDKTAWIQASAGDGITAYANSAMKFRVGTSTNHSFQNFVSDGYVSASYFRATTINQNTIIRGNNSGVDVDIQDVSGNSIAYFEASNKRVGIGTDSPSSHLHVKNASGGATIFVDGDAGSWQSYGFKSGGSTKAEIKNFHESRMEFTQTAGEFRFIKLSDASVLFKIDSNSQISLSNNDSGASNTIFGYTSGGNIASGGDKNTLFGKSTGFSISTGDSNTNLGWEAGYYNATGSNNTAVGSGSMMGASGQNHSNNTSVGFNSLKAITTGNYNVAVGSGASLKITEGVSNVSVGYQSGYNITTGDYNISIGDLASYNNQTGNDNVSVGREALRGATNQSHSDNIAIGSLASYAITTGDDNVAIGTRALLSVTSGANNVSIGSFSLLSNTTTGGNTAIGYQALYTLDQMNTGTPRSVAVGAKAGYYLNGGYDFTAVGYQAGEKSDNNYGNTFVGVVSGKNIDDGHFNTAVGGYALLGADADANDASYNVAVGYSSLQAVTDGDKNTSLGNDSSKAITTGSNNTALGYKSNEVLTTGEMNTYIGAYTKSSAVDITNEVVLGAGDSNDYLVGKGNDTVVIGGENGYIWNAFDTNNTWLQVSDERTKKDIKDSDLGLSFINDLRPVTYKKKSRSEYPKSFDDYNESKTTVKDKKLYGFIAQEVKEAMDKADHSDFTAWTEGKDGMQGLGVTELITPLVKAVQELSTQIDRLKEQLNKES